MKGVEFALCDSKGKVLETLVTDSAGHAESKNYPIATFKNGQYKKDNHIYPERNKNNWMAISLMKPSIRFSLNMSMTVLL